LRRAPVSPDGCCNTGPDDVGLHVVCCRVTAPFLRFAKAQATTTPAPEYRFAGPPGDQWCVCGDATAPRAGVAPPVVLAATHEETLAVVPLSALKELAVDLPGR
jgi:uncharacterized protein (DUF2237 family)